MTHSHAPGATLFPADVLDAIACAVYNAAVPNPTSSLDPLYPNVSDAPTSSPSTSPTSYWSEPVSRQTLVNLCLVSKDFRDAAKPWLWRRIEVNVPRNWLRMLDEICGEAEVPVPQNISAVLAAPSHFFPPPLPLTPPLSPSSSPLTSVPEVGFASVSRELVEQEAGCIATPSHKTPYDLNIANSSGYIPLDLLSPPASRDPSPQRLRAQSPGRWQFIREVNRRIHAEGLYGMYASLLLTFDSMMTNFPTPIDPRPGRYVHHLDFNHFRTIGMRRFVGEGIHSRFVTEARLERLLKEMPNLRAFGATEFMDSSLSPSVLAELILRGLPHRRPVGRGRGASRREDNEEEMDDVERRGEYKALEALDFCGCVSSVFVTSLQQFVEEEGLGLDYVSVPSPNRASSIPAIGHLDGPSLIPVPLKTFPGLKRLCLCGVTSVPPSVLIAFVTSFSSLTHLDLASTRCTPALLQALAASPTIRLYSLSLSRCNRLTSESIADFLIDGGAVTEGIRELNLYGDVTFPCPLTRLDLKKIITKAKCFANGQLEYLDLSGSSLDKSHLAIFSPQLALRSLGLNFLGTSVNVHEGTEGLALSDVREFLLNKAPNVEIVTLVGSTPELTGIAHAAGPRATYAPATTLTTARGAISMALHSQLIEPLCVPPFRTLRGSSRIPPPQPPTRLRVIDLSMSTLSCLGGGALGWKIVKSRGGRAWYVNSTTMWVNGVLQRGVQSGGVTECIERWAREGSATGVGWHARKMEVLHGRGMLGREDGLYGAVSFAYTG
ncbi:uncharacterized protein EI90DRAFT_2966555 [Cantharellus anzutake]|uniref:uncharacterized protein n=1 Tax=Cantharellus anzutake TaxID=1750568 RepID=UPI001903244B|nr:uncharacterized protein EI90DRAFT_2966555 [Cantharellus anzutake]KAF8340662.1 hypothetical protein EI90DRAFT_2966555 [Cantharellus anzutake]